MKIDKVIKIEKNNEDRQKKSRSTTKNEDRQESQDRQWV